MTEETLEYLIKHWTDGEVDDPVADRDTLEALVAELLGCETIVAANKINRWRKEKIEQDKQLRETDEED